MTGPDDADLVADQRAYFLEGNTRIGAWREDQLTAAGHGRSHRPWLAS